ncbi:hypothetical protein [Alienimonas chondri]|uniref:DUF983 domain-containing protein n=1 Tax=Alienimonas chondri TaxID=2681879 RepID=A0ABX1VD72_9PLAN|nr:hypothetical protein [Alienimonas chondri]NNJ26064.1 hypothetical protein [Alienimonas chondri]
MNEAKPTTDAGPAVRSLSCDRCGAPLTVGPRARFVTCTHCDSRLSVHRTDSAAWTETLGEVAEATRRIETKLDALARRPQWERTTDPLADLEQEWSLKRRWLGYWTRRGTIVPPTKEAAANESLFWIIAGPIAAVGWLIAVGIVDGLGGEAAPLYAGLLIVLPIFRACWLLLFAERRERLYVAAEQDYRRRRAELLRSTETKAEDDA